MKHTANSSALSPVEIEDLRSRLEEAEEALRAIRGGEVDALVVYTKEGERIYTLQGADHAYKMMIESIHEGVATMLADGTIVYCNQRLAEMVEVPLESLLGASLADHIQANDRETFKAMIQIGILHPAKTELSLLQKSGVNLPVLISLSPIVIDEKPGVCLVGTDLTEQKRNEANVAAERMARSILEQAAEGIVVCDSSGTIIRASQAAHQLAGKNPLFQPFETIFPLVLNEGQPPEDQFSITQILSGGSLRSLDARLDLAKPAHLLLSATPLRNDRQEILGCIVILSDITERKQNEEQALENAAKIEVQHRLLEQRELERLQIARDLHDGPIQDLAAAMMLLQELPRRIQDPELIGKARGIIEILHDQIGELRSYAGELRPPALTSFGLEKAILSHLDHFQEKYPKIKVNFQPSGAHELPEDKRLALYRIYQELMNNVAKHSRASEVTICYRANQEQVELEIRDNGEGFSLPREWLELARQGHLGLVGIRERIETIRGSVQIETRPGQGTRIRVRVPIEEP